MKKILLVFLLLVSLLPSRSQIIIDPSDMPAESDTFRVSVTTNIPGDYTLTGENMTWDFSALNRMTMQVDTFVSVMNTPNLYWLTFIPGILSNLASPGNNLPSFPGIPFSNFYTFYMKSASSFADNGFAFQLSGLPIMLKYNNPDIYYKFPCTMGDYWNSSSFASLSIPGLAYFGTSRTRTSQVDGWGTLITPFGSFQTIRIKSELTEYDSLFLDTLSIGVPLTRNITEYKWLGKGQGIPLLQINVEGPVSTVFYRDNVYPSGISNIPESTLQIYPNPSDGIINFAIEENHKPLKLQVYDIRGNNVSEKEIPARTGSAVFLDFSNLLQGIYMIRMVTDNSVGTGKIIINQ